ncbi:MAG: IS21 family transposase [Acidobacteria bacterium]|nr:IS21 family transposase [Acidobacteriota bacterium]
MRKIHEVLRLHFDLKLPQRQIARAAQLSQSTVHDYLRRFEAAKLKWPLPEDCDEAQLEARLFGPERIEPPAPSRPLPDFAAVRHELTSNRHTTLQLLWEEYRDAHPEGHYSYPSFCRHYEEWRGRQDLVMRQQHRAGEKLFIDWAGATIPVYDPATGQARPASLFVAALGASSYTYAEATESQELTNWIGAHIRALEFLGGVPELVVPDNAKTAVNKPCRYEPDLNPTYQEMAMHYGIGVVPARVRKPRDKAKVEAAVQVAQRWIVAALRHRRFFSLPDLNGAIAELLEKLNRRPFRKREGCRGSVFEEVDRPALRPLPAQRYDQSVWSKAVVNIDYHVQVDHSFYSVPYTLARQGVEVRTTPSTVEIFHRGTRVASHLRARKPNTAVTVAEHRPKSHREHLQWPPSRLIDWARKTGVFTAQLFQQILDGYPHPEMGYRSCLGLLRLGEKYGPRRLEAACERALVSGAASYKSVKSILLHALDTQPLPESPEPLRGAGHDNIRGAEYYQ